MSHPGNDLTPSTSHRSGFHLLGNILGLWSSDLNRAVVEELDPQPGHMLLDIGAGLGPATIEAAKHVTPGGRVIAVEPSLFMRSVLRLRSSWQRSRRAVDIRVGSAENLPVADRSIDAAWAVNAVHHFEDIECAFSQLARVLKPGGRAILIEEDFDHHPGYRSHADDPDSSLDTDALVEILGATNLNVATSHYKVGGVSALVIFATKPTDRTVNGGAPDNTQTEGTTP